LEALFESGRIVTLILVAVALEAAVLLWLLRRAGRLAFGVAANLAAGACLLMAVRSALAGEPWPSTALWLALSLPAHLLDLGLRLAGRPAP
jgi:hypothetical protein